MRKHLSLLLLAATSNFVAGDALAAAFALPQQGVSGLGNAYAGAAAVAEDASTPWWNPSGMSRLRSGMHMLVAGNLISPYSKFSDGGSNAAALSNPNSMRDGGNSGSPALVPSFFFAMDLDAAWSAGVGVTVPFGLKTEYEPRWIGRFQGISSEVKTTNINPSVSYKLSPTASIGAGANYQRGEIELVTAANYSAAAFAAAGPGGLAAVGGPGVEGVNTTKLDGHAWGFNAGALFDLTPTTRLGLHYRSSLTYKLDGTTAFGNVPAALASSPSLANGNVRAELKTPAMASASVAHKLDQTVELLGDITWTQWSKIQRVTVVRDTGETLNNLAFNFDDAWRYSVGVTYKLSDLWSLKGGIAYDETPIRRATDRTVRLADSDLTWLSVGAAYRMKKSRLDFGYTYVMVKNAEINNDQSSTGAGTVTGTYKAHAHLVGLAYQYSFD